MTIVTLARSLGEFRLWAKLAKGQTGKSIARQLAEIRALRGSGGRCGISDYYWYRLYDDEYQCGDGTAEYLGWRLQGSLSLALNPRHAVLPAWDKTVFTQLAHGAGLPVAPVMACYHPAKRIPDVLGRHLADVQAAATFLRDESNYPLFGKPAYSQQGHGSAYLVRYDPSLDRIERLDGSATPVEEFTARLQQPVDGRYHRPECGYLFQSGLKPASEISRFTQWHAICGVRIVCLNDENGVEPIRAVWKIAVPPNHVDNFSLGKYGNLLADIDLTTGQVRRMLDGFWPSTKLHEAHPVSGQSIQGLRLPGWAQLLDACHQAGAVFPLMRIHHWDFALTDQGPKMLELNDLGATEMLQLHGRGLLDQRMRLFLKKHADGLAHPWVQRL
jgi:hypothetical protein